LKIPPTKSFALLGMRLKNNLLSITSQRFTFAVHKIEPHG
jgi:hypothetical protein